MALPGDFGRKGFKRLVVTMKHQILKMTDNKSYLCVKTCFCLQQHWIKSGAPNDSFLSDPLKRYFRPECL